MNFFGKYFRFIIFLSFGMFQYLNSAEVGSYFHEHEWVNRYFNSVDENTTVEEIVDFLVSVKMSLEAKGCKVLPLTRMCLYLKDELINRGIKVDDNAIRFIYDEIAKKESVLIIPSSFSFATNNYINTNFLQIKNNEEEVSFSERFAKGFMKAFAGSLLCIVPHPVAWSIGSGLVGSGIIDMIEGASEASNQDDSLEERMRTFLQPTNK